MGNREDLLAGARAAILRRGLAKTTARDIAGAAGVSLAAIGYHFGSKDRLITEAIADALGSGVGDELEAAIRHTGSDTTLWQALASIWDAMCEVRHRHSETMLLSAENALLVARSPDSQEFMGESTRTAIHDLRKALAEQHSGLSEEQAIAVAKLFFLTFQGFAMLSIIAPDAVDVTGADIALAVQTLHEM
ncbi:TetR/AcrR family transcriptional regulator [Nocardia sp. NPDC051030]|uniref:TetR/AcrR family transcriptional regulator n=1 Tax=Nocardia sp. NPDC051030 TaxID=3155162 RepID=UPI00342FF5CA